MQQVVLTLLILAVAQPLWGEVRFEDIDDLLSGISKTEDGITLDRSYLFKNESRSQIKWDELEPDQWLSFPLWEQRRLQLQQTPLWRLKLRAKEHREVIGYLISCVGKCLNYPGEGDTFYTVEHRSRLWERDEVVTSEHSYAWIFLMDGSLVRVGPSSSLSLVEIDVGSSNNLIYARVNRGVVFWLSREEFLIDQPLIRESDALFLPLPFMEANTFTWDVKQLQQAFRADVSLKWLPDDVQILEQAKRERLNHLIADNNKTTGRKRTQTIIELPNGTLIGDSIRADVVVLEMGDSYIKNRPVSWVNRKTKEAPSPLMLNVFGTRDKGDEEMTSLVDGSWYTLSARGETLSTLNGSEDLLRMLSRMELVTLRIPSILIARELWMQKRSLFIFKQMSSKELAVNFGYQLWDRDDIAAGGLDIAKRESFLVNNLVRAAQRRFALWDLLQEELKTSGGEQVAIAKFDSRFYQRAYEYYTANQTPFFLPKVGEAGSNSFRSKFWLRYYVDRKR
jgi:hypothetical protein